MPMQTQIYTDIALGVPGDMATPDQFVYQAVNYTAEEPCTVGNFVWYGSDPSKQAKPNTSGTDAPLGLVQRNLSYMDYDLKSPGTLLVPEESTLMIAVRGDFFVKTLTNATIGQAVFASTADGSISTAAPGATVSGCVETAWRVKTNGLAGDIIIISNW